VIGALEKLFHLIAFSIATRPNADCSRADILKGSLCDGEADFFCQLHGTGELTIGEDDQKFFAAPTS
jgi:hypothetical protein